MKLGTGCHAGLVVLPPTRDGCAMHMGVVSGAERRGPGTRDMEGIDTERHGGDRTGTLSLSMYRSWKITQQHRLFDF